MPLEATMLVLDNSEWMRNGDYTPSRWEAQSDAVNVLFNAKTNSNPENEVGLMTMAGKSPEVLVTLTKDIGKLLTALHSSTLSGAANICTGINIAQLALKHRENKNQRQRIIAFVGSPIPDAQDSLIKLGKKLKKNNVAVDIINFGENGENEEKLRAFVESVDSGENSHLLSIPPGPQLLSDIILSSSVLSTDVGGAPGISTGGDGGAGGDGGFDFGVDPSMDPELAMALRMSLEEEQARQRATVQSSSVSAAPVLSSVGEEPRTRTEDGGSAPEPALLAGRGSLIVTGAESITGAGNDAHDADEEAMLARALALSQRVEPKQSEDAEMAAATSSALDKADSSNSDDRTECNPQDDDEEMTEEEAIARAIEMSLQKKE
ncbi:hypothetical protein K437DRAFT_252013 [Tilletiaria anomala UBC 951]|uniref:VWFA domain-containing protein n=1 Tax=Tilletiaria anomala (strain ATCC 24038 / CBS 436.72 / UBC 951) TaxID=1037660 RepID=A0A066VF54_TILAU|nr:uncharacterized protein K437DRAFT_252013 [Tilletiaria anomala UBC 951]KDN37230.1 hypothetical protein K437DRAFT_252013 [Tilletiaria anomala UBC 951]